MASAQGPGATTRHVLLTLALHMDATGGSCWPSVRTLAEETGLSRRAVMEHIEKAASEGWVKRWVRGAGGRGWRLAEYQATVPDHVVIVHNRDITEGGDPHSPRQADGGHVGSPRERGGGHPRAPEVVTEGDLNSTNNSTKGVRDDKIVLGPPTPSPVFLRFPLKPNGGVYDLTEQEVRELEDLYPSLDVRQALRDCFAWNLANPARRKTARGIRRHIVGWIRRESNQARYVSPGQRPEPTPPAYLPMPD